MCCVAQPGQLVIHTKHNNPEKIYILDLPISLNGNGSSNLELELLFHDMQDISGRNNVALLKCALLA